MINNNIDLWSTMMGVPVDDITEEEAKARVTNQVFKLTDCGCSFDCTEDGISLTGYAENSEIELPSHSLEWGFTYDEWNGAMAEADAEGVLEWYNVNMDWE